MDELRQEIRDARDAVLVEQVVDRAENQARLDELRKDIRCVQALSVFLRAIPADRSG